MQRRRRRLQLYHQLLLPLPRLLLRAMLLLKMQLMRLLRQLQLQMLH